MNENKSMKCINCIYFPCIRFECDTNSCCDYYKSVVEEELNRIDSRATELEGRWNK